MLKQVQVGDVLYAEDHRYIVHGVYIGAEGCESVLEIETISHKPGSMQAVGISIFRVPGSMLSESRIFREVKP